MGGLSVLPALRRALPHESFVYVADSGHAPYGERTEAQLIERAEAVVGFLFGQGARGVVLACNTLSVAAAGPLRKRFERPVVAMEPAIKPAVARSRARHVLVLATTGTIASAAVARLCSDHGVNARVDLQACPGLVERIERGELATPDTRCLIERYVAPAVGAGADTIVLGCTHYAFLAEAIQAVAGPGVALVEPSEAIARQLVRVCPPNPAQTGAGEGAVRYFTSGEVTALASFIHPSGAAAAAVQRLPV